MPFDALIVCTGATDRLMPVEGWNLAGVLQPGRRADRAEVAGLRDRPAGRLHGHRAAAVPGRLAVRARPARTVPPCSTPRPCRGACAALPKLLARPRLLLKGMALVARPAQRAGVPVLHRRHAAAHHRCATAGVQGVTVRDGRRQRAALRLRRRGPGLPPARRDASSPTWRAASSVSTRSRANGCPKVDGDGRSTVAGRLPRRRRRAHPRRRWRRERPAAWPRWPCWPIWAARSLRRRCARCGATLAQHGPLPRGPGAGLPVAAAQAAHCPIERWSAAAKRSPPASCAAWCARWARSEANRAKAFSRVGMGRCQGRLLRPRGGRGDRARRRRSGGAVGRLRGQAPVKPLPMRHCGRGGAMS